MSFLLWDYCDSLPQAMGLSLRGAAAGGKPLGEQEAAHSSPG
ncbi:hypothetical protein [Azotobacter beijerinckii]|nr:hypothetical protein [Azotobacter beijerinckii]